MESLLPSEIARLVYGYLIEEKCEAAAQLFLESSSSLQECRVFHKKGRKFNTSVLGLSLVDILNLYTDAVCLVKNYLERKETLNQALSDFVKELGNILVLDNESGHNIAKTVFLRISVPTKRKAHSRSEPGENNEEEEEEEEIVKQIEKEQKKSSQDEQQKSEEDEEAALPKTNSNVDDFDLNMLQALLDNTALHERLAENINKAIDSSGEVTNHKTDEKKIVETILHNTEADPIFHELLDDLVAPRAEDTTSPEDTDKENGDPSEEKQTTHADIRPSTSEDPETSKKIEEESTLAVEQILAGNKQMQQEQVIHQPIPPEAVIISTPQMVEGSNGIYKQSYIIPAGYTVTDVIPTTSVPYSSSTLQPLKIANVATFGHLSPILPQQMISSSTPRCVPRRRKILPKSETYVIQIQNQDDNTVQQVKVDVAPPAASPSPKKVPNIMKRSRVRTRGGLQKVGSRGVKAIMPQVPRAVDDNIEVVFAPSPAQKVYGSGIKTRAMSKNQQKHIKPCTINVELLENIKEQSNEGNSEEVIQIEKEYPNESKIGKTIESDNSKEIEKQEDNDKTKEMDKPEENDKTKEMDKPEENVKTKEIDKPEKNVKTKEIDKPEENEKTKEVDKPEENDKTKEIDEAEKMEISEEIVKTREIDKSKETENPKEKENPKEPENPPENESLKVNEQLKENNNKEENDGTPEQQSILSKPRVSLSTPRRSHIRALDFTTPVKELALRKSLTSPKVYLNKIKDTPSLEVIKRGMFKSPPKEISKEDQKADKSDCKKKKKDWDADLRKYTAVGEGMDIPTSVGLKRKNTTKKLNSGKGKALKRRVTTRKKFVKKKSTDDLVDQIEKEVKDVIGEEEMVLNTSISSEMGTLIEQKLVEEMNKNDDTSTSVASQANDNTTTEVSSLPTIPEESPSSKKDSELPNEKVHQISEFSGNGFQDTINDSNSKEPFSSMAGGLNTSTPLKITLSPIHENSRGQLTPTTKLVMTHLGKVSPRFPHVFSPSSQSSLENILIRECSRMEAENASSSQVALDIKKLDSSEIDTANLKTNTHSESGNKKVEDKNELNDCNKESTFLAASKSNVHLFQTPAKLFASIPPGTPVEMTPLTKVLVSETSFAATMLVTPTLPPTPKNLSSCETPQKTDDSTNAADNISGNDCQKFPEKSIFEPEKSQEDPSPKETCKKSNLELNEDTVQSHCSSTKNEDMPYKSTDIKFSPDKTAGKTPKIKLMSPKLSDSNESTLDKKLKKNQQRCRSIEENVSKPIHDITLKGKLGQDSLAEIGGRKIDCSQEQAGVKSSARKSPQNTKKTKNQTPAGKKQLNTLKSKKLSCNDNNKLSKKVPKQKITKQVTKLMVEKEMELEIEHLLKDAKAKLFGTDNSSDSDSDSASDISLSSASGMKASNSQLKTARARLQKLENIRMLNSSSTSDDSSENETSLEHKVIEKDIPTKDDTILLKRASLDIEQSNSRHSSEGLTKKNVAKKFDDVNSNKQMNLNTISKECEESCESFPTLHLSEESNQSLKSDNNLMKHLKTKRSPLNVNDLPLKKTNASLLAPSVVKPHIKPVEDQISKDKVSKSGERHIKSNISEKNKGQPSVHVDERVFRRSGGDERTKAKVNETVDSTLPSPSSKSNTSIRSTSKYLDDYVYSFKLNVDKSGNCFNKELRTSSFLDIFTLDDSSGSNVRSYKEPVRIDHKSHDRSRSRNRKRHRSASSSEDEREKREHDRKYISYRSGRGRDYRSYRKNESYDRRDFSFSRRRYSLRGYDKRHHDFCHSSPYDKRRSPDFKRSVKREDRRTLEDKVSPNKYGKISYVYEKRFGSANESFASSISGSDPDGKYTDINSVYSDRTVESRKDRGSSSSQRLTIVEDQPFYSKPKPVPRKKVPKSSDKEDGELTDSSEVKRISPEENRSLVLALGAHDSRATLLKKVDLDHFLSIVHGNEK